MEQYEKIQQLLKKEPGTKERVPIFPPTVIQAVFDAKTGASLEAILAQFNSVFVQYQGSPRDTRLAIPMEMRRPGLTITYTTVEGDTLTERANSQVTQDDNWALDTNWSRIDELSLSGDIAVSARGTWIINGADTGIKAVGPKGENGITPWLKEIDNKLHYSYDNVKWTSCSGPLSAQFRNHNNRIQISYDKGKTWTDISDPVATYVRFAATSSTSQDGSIGKLQYSYDKATWHDLSPEFRNYLRIQGYVSTHGKLPTGVPVGTIYGVGPFYEVGDINNTNPMYQLQVWDGTQWVHNGRFNSIAAGIVQETGDSETEVMSQKAVSEKLSELGSKVNISSFNLIDTKSCTYGHVIYGDGTIKTDFNVEEYCVSDFIPVYKKDIIANSFINLGWGSFNVYDKSKVLLRTITESQQYNYVEGDFYIRICIKWDNDITNIRAYFGNTLYDYIKYNPIDNYIAPDINIIYDELTSLLDGNLIDPRKITRGKLIYTLQNAEIRDFSDRQYCITDYIPVNRKNITANTFYNSSFSAGNVYNEKKEFIRTLGETNHYNYVSGDYYVRFILKAPLVTDLMANYGDTLLSYTPYFSEEKTVEKNIEIKPLISYDDMNYNITNRAFVCYQAAKIFNNSKCYVDYFIYKTLGNTLTLLSFYIDSSGILRYKKEEEVITLIEEWKDTSLGENVYKIPYGKLIDYIPAPLDVWLDNTIDVNNNNGYIAVGAELENPPISDTTKSYGFGIIGTAFEPLLPTLSETYNEIKDKINLCKGKKIGFLGDSITDMGYYIDSLVKLSGIIPFNYGESGTHYACVKSFNEDAFETRVSKMEENLDAVIVFGGTNDFGHGSNYWLKTASFGRFNDYTKANIFSFYAGLHRTFKKLYDKYRGKPIIVMTPLHHGYEVDTPEYIFNEDGTITEGVNDITNKTFKEYVNAIKEVAAYYSFFIIDAYSESGLNPCLESSENRIYFTDGLHPNRDGGERLAKYILPKMENIFKSFCPPK